MGRLWPLGLREVVLAGGSTLGDWQQRNHDRTLPHCAEQVVASGALRNLERAARGQPGAEPHEGMHFSDSDVYKVLEALAWDSVRGAGTATSEFAEQALGLIERAQRPDGYLNSWAQGQRPDLVWKDLRWGHELYCAGHLLQAAVAERRAGWGERLSEVSNRLVGHLLQTFSRREGDGGLVGVCGHPLVETALVEHYRCTGDAAALELAQRQVELRGRPDVGLPTTGLLGDRRFPLSYFLHHVPVRERTSATGHAVRELYLQAGVVDVATETGDTGLLAASEAIWEDLFSKKTYVTGAHGSRHRDESIGDPYELPSDRAYAETCAAIASFQWNWRLLLATGQARYAREMEQVFWNTVAGSVSREGTAFYYSNSLQVRTGHDAGDEDSPDHRLPWYQCACCPPNLARLLGSIQAYLVTRGGSGLQVHMPFSGTISTRVAGTAVELALRTGHPWEGATTIDVLGCDSSVAWELSFRAPDGQGPGEVLLSLNGQRAQASSDGGYLRLSRRWAPGDRLEISAPMPVRTIEPHWRADALRGCVAFQRGPLLYCLEAQDLDGGAAVEDVTLEGTGTPEVTGEVPEALDGYVKFALVARGSGTDGPPRPLYRDRAAPPAGARPVPLTLVPYFARGNRELAPMRVWVPTAPAGAPADGRAATATREADSGETEVPGAGVPGAEAPANRAEQTASSVVTSES